MNTYETFVLAVAGFSLFVLLVVIIGVGGLLTIATASIALIGYYPCKLFEWLDSKLFKKG